MNDLTIGDGQVTAPDGLALSTRQWLPDDPRAVLLFVHGLGEHSGRYDYVARRFAARGFACYAQVVKAYVNDPLVSRRVSARWFTEILAAQEVALANAPRLAVPALVMQSGADRLVDGAATRSWAAAAPAALVEFVEWEGLYHEMFNEPEKETVFARTERWLERRL